MAGTNVTNLISSTIAILKATTKNYNIVKDDKGLREAFHEAGRGLLLVEEALQTAKIQLDARGSAEDPQSAMSSLEACNTKATLSESIFKDVAEAPETSRFESYKAAVQQQGKGKTAEVLTLWMMKDVCELAENDTIKEIMQNQVKGLRDAIDKLLKMEPSVPKEGSGNTFNSYDDSRQFNAPGGTQDINTGSGNQFSRTIFSGSVTFGRTS
ncbi:uncharacterized protein BDR25DRAFT_208321 [Lindgomyces ingoldianus]|uniref:Uncharacterized protein n=1 Tax=Lindgomyces ingoldianus TaxID=673940 RepID=A0ACB6REL8_9PLEO|nr:uncharacterized protein BDR25DRAFT_208321 [Lindgomyces ingoldianus]KAF2477160.1 hypothetical protein BDR25DRAFT_208321 [Lindgomyces ingoldianus]